MRARAGAVCGGLAAAFAFAVAGCAGGPSQDDLDRLGRDVSGLLATSPAVAGYTVEPGLSSVKLSDPTRADVRLVADLGASGLDDFVATVHGFEPHTSGLERSLRWQIRTEDGGDAMLSVSGWDWPLAHARFWFAGVTELGLGLDCVSGEHLECRVPLTDHDEVDSVLEAVIASDSQDLHEWAAEETPRPRQAKLLLLAGDRELRLSVLDGQTAAAWWHAGLALADEAEEVAAVRAEEVVVGALVVDLAPDGAAEPQVALRVRSDVASETEAGLLADRIASGLTWPTPEVAVVVQVSGADGEVYHVTVAAPPA